MARSKQSKVEIVDDLARDMGRMQSAVFVNFTGLKVKDAQKLRERTWGQDLGYTVAKKTLLARACEQAGITCDPRSFEGNIGIAFGFSDSLAVIKASAEFSKNHEAFKIIGGVFEGKYIPATEVIALSKLPGRQELLGQLVGQLQAPIQAFVRTLAEVPTGLVRVVHAISQKSA